MDRELVLLARTVRSETTASTRVSTSTFDSARSGTASTTRPTSDGSRPSSATTATRSSTADGSSDNFPRSAALATPAAIRSRAAATAVSSLSTTHTSAPRAANTCAIPAPIRPPPITPTDPGSAAAFSASTVSSDP